ncbi:MAG: SCO family protein [Phycisphaerales bacterium]
MLQSLRPSRLLARLPALLPALLCALACVAVGSASASGQINPKEPPASIRGLDITERLGETIPLDLVFTDSSGKPVTLGSMFNEKGMGGVPKPVVLALVYYRCPLQCPTILNRLNDRFNQINLTIGDDYNVAVVSFDASEPRDSAANVKADQFTLYTRVHPKNLDDSWRFMTSDSGPVRTLADAVGFPYRYLPESNEYAHGTVIFVLTPEGRISRYLYGIDYPADQLKLALLEASGGKIGTTLDRVLIWCFHYDPSAGAYVVQAVRVMQIGGAVTLTALCLLLGSLLLVEKRRRAARSRTQRRPLPNALPVTSTVMNS